MTQMCYQWAVGSRFGADAQQVGERCEAIRAANDGALTPELLVTDAADPASPLHPCFQWDDERAAIAYRLSQAREILRSIVVYPDDRMPKPVRAFVAVFVAPEDRKRYVGIEEALTTPALRRQLLEQALREIRLWRIRYAQYSELARLLDSVDRELELFDTDEERAEVFAIHERA